MNRAISELRRISGLSWDELGDLFDVSRRSVHFWASGQPLDAANEARVLRALDVAREANRGDSRRTRAALLRERGGHTPFDLLASQRFEEARALVGPGATRPRPRKMALADEKLRARRPPPPATRVEVEHARVHRDVGRGRAARTARRRRRGGSR